MANSDLRFQKLRFQTSYPLHDLELIALRVPEEHRLSATQRLAGVSLPDTVYVGLFVCSHNASVTERAMFSKVRIGTAPKLH